MLLQIYELEIFYAQIFIDFAGFRRICLEIVYLPTIDEQYSTLAPPLESCDTFAGSRSDVGANEAKTQCK